MPNCIKNKMNGLPIILLMIIFVFFETPAFGIVKDYQMEFSNNELAAEIENVPLGAILEEIHKNTKIEFFLEECQSDKVISVEFGFLPLEKALSRILRNLSYAILFGVDDKILRVTIIGTRKTSPTTYTESVADDQFAGRQMDTETLSEVKKEGQVSDEDHDIIVEPTSTVNEMPIDPPSGEEMSIASPSPEDMILIDPPSSEEMEITYSSTTMAIEPQSNGD